MRRMGICIITALALAACASNGATEGQTSGAARDCFRSADANGFGVIDDHHVRISIGANRNYILETSWNARDLDWTQAIAIRSATGSICTGNGLGVQLIGGDPRRTYPVVSITRAPEDDTAAQGS